MLRNKKIFNEICSFEFNNMITFRKILFGELINYSQSLIGYAEKLETSFTVYNWKGDTVGNSETIEGVYSILNIQAVYPFDSAYEEFQKWQMEKDDSYVLQEKVKSFLDVYKDYHSVGKIH